MAITLFFFHREPRGTFWISTNFEFDVLTCSKFHLGKAARLDSKGAVDETPAWGVKGVARREYKSSRTQKKPSCLLPRVKTAKERQEFEETQFGKLRRKGSRYK